MLINPNIDSYIFNKSFKSGFKKMIKPKRHKMSEKLYNHYYTFYFYRSCKISKDYSKYKLFLNKEDYLKEILLIDNDKQLNYILKNFRHLYIKRSNCVDPINVYNYVHAFDYEREDKIVLYVKENIDELYKL